MKCDELQRYSLYIDHEKQAFAVPDDDGTYMDSSEVDAAIAELKQKLEDAKATAYADSVDAGMENRKLKRALWLARAERAKDRKYKYETWERNEMKKFNWDGDLIAIVSMKARKWRRVEIKCLKKAEEYK